MASDHSFRVKNHFENFTCGKHYLFTPRTFSFRMPALSALGSRFFFFNGCEYVQEVAEWIMASQLGKRLSLASPIFAKEVMYGKFLIEVSRYKNCGVLVNGLERRCVCRGSWAPITKGWSTLGTRGLRHHNVCSCLLDKSLCSWHRSILTWHRGHRDHEGGSPRARPFHCTSIGLTLAITPNVGDSGA